MNAYKETLPDSASETLGSVGLDDEPVLMHLASDLLSNRQFGRQWVVVTEKRLIVVPHEGESDI